MAAALGSISGVDLNTTATFPVRLGTSISKPSENDRYASVRYNHSSRLKNPAQAKSLVRPTKRKLEDEVELVLKDGKDEYIYSGRNKRSRQDYILLKKADDVVLEKLYTVGDFNVTKTPTEHDSGKLAKQYPHLCDGADAANENSTTSTKDSRPDSDNPFDYRHYLKTGINRAAQQITETSQKSNGATQHTRKPPDDNNHPVSRPSSAKPTNSPLLAEKKRNTTAHSSRTNPERTKPVTSKLRTSSPPTLRLDRKATLDTTDNTGELILENDDKNSVPSHHHNAMSLALSGLFQGDGPVSLKSVASSPALQAQEEAGEEEKESLDGDVEGLELGPPQIEPKGGALREADEEAEDDLDAQLQLAMAEEDGEEPDGEGETLSLPVPELAAADESEESEEE